VEIQALRRRAEAIAGDRDRGAAELLVDTLPLLAEALAAGAETTLDLTRLICNGQPAMAPLWNACAAAVADRDEPGRFARARAEMERAPAALVRAAGLALRDALGDADAPRLLTLSYSSSVARVLGALAGERRLDVVCGEGRPRCEGRRLASELASAGATVTLTTDAALTSRLDAASAVVVGADAVGRSMWINKAGTRGLAAAAHLGGVPLFVVCTRDKVAADALIAGITHEGPPGEVWEQRPAAVGVANPYFERIPTALATLFLMESGPVGPDDLSGVTQRYGDAISALLTLLTAS
jgi:translation initiation factor 2B subunit (eIF-2B alpha/beta/delta family)